MADVFDWVVAMRGAGVRRTTALTSIHQLCIRNVTLPKGLNEATRVLRPGGVQWS